jgi:hypothetical protein
VWACVPRELQRLFMPDGMSRHILSSLARLAEERSPGRQPALGNFAALCSGFPDIRLSRDASS